VLRQHFLCDARYQPPQFSEPVGALMQPPENERFPFATDDIDRRLNRTIVVFTLMTCLTIFPGSSLLHCQYLYSSMQSLG
jgi:hypothetical protein